MYRPDWLDPDYGAEREDENEQRDIKQTQFIIDAGIIVASVAGNNRLPTIVWESAGLMPARLWLRRGRTQRPAAPRNGGLHPHSGIATLTYVAEGAVNGLSSDLWFR
jgi:hypothetical protein